jgi:hypothetical protein
MDLSKFLLTLRHEVQKSYDLVDSVGESASALYLALEKIEFDLPVTLDVMDYEYKPEEFKRAPFILKKLNLPFNDTLAIFGKQKIPKKIVKGKVIDVNLLGHVEKLDEKISAERLARIKVVFKPILK